MKLVVGSCVFAPRPVPTLMSLCFFVVFLCLARWQWHRADYKEQLQRQYAQGEHAAPLALSAAANMGKDVAGFPVVLDGHFDEAHTVLLDNQVEKGVPGFQVLTLFQTGQNEAVLIQRGWLAMGKDRQHFSPVPPLAQTAFHLHGKIYFPSARQFVLKEDDYTQVRWPLLVQKLDLKPLGTALGVELAPFVVRLDEDMVVEAGQQLPRHWQFIVISADKSRGYAFQWLGMALVLLGFYLYFSVEKGSVDE
jgi:surfeit locus 1 family protein